MTSTRKLKYEAGTCAIYEVDDLVVDDSPFYDPANNIDRLEFHSDLDYLAIQSIQTGTLSLPSRSGTTPGTYRHNIITHGLGYQPLILGHIENYEGYNTPLLGTTPIRMASDRTAFDAVDMRTLQLGADETYVYIHEYMMLINTSLTYPAVDIDWRVMFTTRNLDLTSGNNNTVTHPSALYIDPTRVVFGQGKFDSDRDHIAKVASGGFPVTIGNSWAVTQETSLGTPAWAIRFRWSVNGQARGTTFAGLPTVTNTVVEMDAI